MEVTKLMIVVGIAVVLMTRGCDAQSSKTSVRRNVGKTGSKTSKTGSAMKDASPFGKMLDQLCGVPSPPTSGSFKCDTNARRMRCIGSCARGFQFSTGEASVELTCYPNGEWSPSNKFPDCHPICDPPCENGGTCIGNNRCLCDITSWGDYCEVPVSVCDVHAVQRSVGYHCNHTQTLMTCTINCPQGMQFDEPPSPHYTCNTRGEWQPPYIPECRSNNLMVHSGQQQTFIETESISSTTVTQAGTCTAWSGRHFQTFDGQVYSVEGFCTYLLVKDCLANTFAIHLEMDSSCSGASPCSPAIQVYVDNQRFDLKKSGSGRPVLTRGNKQLKIPSVVNNLVIEEVSNYVVVSSTLGFTLVWDGQDSIQVVVVRELRYNTCGLCGRFDGSNMNDLETADGFVTENILTFVNSWKMNAIGDVCEDAKYLHDSCAANARERSAGLFCSRIFETEYNTCLHAVDPTPYIEACRNDYCACDKRREDCGCLSMSAYFEDCNRQIGQMQNTWRRDDFCPVTCPSGMVYKDCGSNCPPTCKNQQRECAEEYCLDGCFCPDGTVRHGDECLPPEDCPCTYMGQEYKSSSTYQQDCNTCMCYGGHWQCTKETCEARCSSVGDPHYITFDGKRYDFMGKCTYLLISHANFSIEQETVGCDGAISKELGFSSPSHGHIYQPSCTKSLTIRIQGTELRLKQGLDMLLNGREVKELPTSTAGLYLYEASSMYVKVELANGVTVSWDKSSRVYIDAPPSLVGQTRGLCGTFTQNQRDDFLTRDGDIEHNANSFANKWKTEDDCDDVEVTESLHDPCGLYIQRKSQAQQLCGVLNSDVFSRCQDYVDPAPFYHNCMYDMCSCRAEVGECLCSALADYAASCAKLGVSLNWRESVPDCPAKCRNGQVYDVCGSSCQRSCIDIANNPNCREQCTEGCNCPRSFTLSFDGECIPVSHCPCIYNEEAYEPGHTDIRERQSCTCVNAKWECRAATSEELLAKAQEKIEKPLCSEHENFEPVDCEELCPRTCANMHNQPACNTAACKPGCRCKDGYVLDTNTHRCVYPSHCSCTHNSKIYGEGETMRQECNLCVCVSGHWNCEKKNCPETCTAWGESHFKTFDDHFFEFVGDCEYTMVQGHVDAHKTFTVNVQNMPCGTGDSTCFKTVTLNIGSETLVLSRDRPVPESTSDEFIVREAGLFVIVHTVIGVTIHWDKGTRVYVTLDTRWQGKVEGLCGNYNENAQDDFRPPLGGPALVRASKFADSWKTFDQCSDSKQWSDMCVVHPERQSWALKRCSVLKSEMFSLCHAEVSVDTYLERCVSDTCACDTGGDCDCFCTAVAAYAQECNLRGLPILWRSQDLCPIMCRTCDKYVACLSSCPKKTCETEFLYGELQGSCHKDMCVEGCEPPPCAADEIFSDDKEYKCIPRSECVRQPCKVINGIMYHEGERISDPEIVDTCESCHCKNGTLSCTGEKCAASTVTPHIAVPAKPTYEPVCRATGWTEWANSYTPTYKNGGDYERLVDMVTGPYHFCPLENIVAIECRTVGTHHHSQDAGQVVHCNLPEGLNCENIDQDTTPLCHDYEIRVFCSCEPTTAPYEEISSTPGTVQPRTLLPQVRCIAPGWTAWMNAATPEANGERETIPVMRKKYLFCGSAEIEEVQCREADTRELHESHELSAVECTKERGAVCKNEKGRKKVCPDMEVRFYCRCEKADCDYPRGMETGNIRDDQITVSSFRSIDSQANNPRLNGNGAWSPTYNQPAEWIQIDLEEIQEITGIRTQGSPRDLEWVTSYKIQYSEDGFHWNTMKLNGDRELFLGNVDQNTPHDNLFPPVRAKLVRIVPSEWVNGISLRVELLGCNKFVTQPPSRYVSTTAPPRKTKKPTIQVATLFTPNCTQTGWTEWMDSDSPFSDEKEEIENYQQGDNELIPNLRYFYSFCVEPTAAQCRVVDSQQASHTTGQKVECDTAVGLKCINAEQPDGKCLNYEISFYCECESTTTPKPTTTTAPDTRQPPSCENGSHGYTRWMNAAKPAQSAEGDMETYTALRERFEFCEQQYISHIQCRVAKDKTPYDQAGQNGVVCNINTGLVCLHSMQVDGTCKDYEVQFYCLCLEKIVTVPPITVSEVVKSFTASIKETQGTQHILQYCDDWTDWYDFDTPLDSVEEELLSNIGNFDEICPLPTAYQCNDIETDRPYHEFGLRLVERCNRVGIVCHGDENQICPNFKIRVFCECPVLATTPMTPKMPEKCSPGWTGWFNSDHPQSGGGDFERIDDLKSYYEFCKKEQITNIECQTDEQQTFVVASEIGDFQEASFDDAGYSHPLNYFETGDKQVKCNRLTGLECYNSLQDPGKTCHDYRVRFYCTCEMVPMPKYVPTPTYAPVPQVCNDWTEWLNLDDPWDGSEEEYFSNIPNFQQTCPIVKKVECVETESRQSYTAFMHLPIEEACTTSGIRCVSTNDDSCPDFEIRAYCECEGVPPVITTTTVLPCTEGWTDWFNIDDPTSGDGDYETMEELRQRHMFCSTDQITEVECKAKVSGSTELVDFRKTGDVGIKCSKNVGAICYGNLQPKGQKCKDYSIRLHCSCGPVLPVYLTTLPTLAPAITTTPRCRIGYQWDDCAYRCDHMCHSFLKLSIKRGDCLTDASRRCVPGCRKVSCDPPRFWRDEWTCVDKKECTCLTDDEKIIPAGGVANSDPCERCQCINNALTCLTDAGCKTTVTPYARIVSITTSIPVKTTQPFVIPIEQPDCWTLWVNVDSPTTGFGDYESISTIRAKYEFCEHPVKIECREVTTQQNYEAMAQSVECDLSFGLSCQNQLNGRDGCFDYEVRFYCPCEYTTTTPIPPPTVASTVVPIIGPCVHGYTEWFSVHKPDARGEYESIATIRESGRVFCSNEDITAIQCRDRLTGVSSDESGLQGSVCSLHGGFLCRNSDQPKGKKCRDYEVRFLCDCLTTAAPTTTRRTTPHVVYLSTKVALKTGPTTVLPACAYWSRWINDDDPMSGTGDEELMTPGKLTSEEGFCTEGDVTEMECVDVTSGVLYSDTDQDGLTCRLDKGFVCLNAYQSSGICRDYKLRYYCSCETTVAPTTTSKPPLTTTTTTIIIIPSPPTPVRPCNSYVNLIEHLPDENLKATSSMSSNLGPQGARLNANTKSKLGGAWTAKDQNADQYLEVDFGSVHPVYGILTQGHAHNQEWVRSYKILHSRDGISYSYYTNGDGSVRIFSGNFDNVKTNRIIFDRPFEARFVRIQPVSWRNQISMRVELLGCSQITTLAPIPLPSTAAPVCTDPMGIENMKLGSSQISASSYRDASQGPASARLNAVESGNSAGGWLPKVLDTNQYLQIDFGEPRTLTGIVTQGRDDHDQWVMSYEVQFSNDGKIWNPVVDESHQAQTFGANYDSNSPVTNYFLQSLRARYLRIVPKTWNNWISLRVEVLGCYEPYPETTLPEKVLEGTVPVPTMAYLCLDEMGFENGQISDDMVTVSSSKDGPRSDGSQIRLNHPSQNERAGGWVAGTLNAQQFVEINLGEPSNLTGITIQGRDGKSEWVTKFKVLYKLKGGEWKEASNSQGQKVFIGNSDSSTTKINMFENVLTAQYVRIVPLEWHNWISMRMELLGCFKPYPKIGLPTCDSPMGLENGEVTSSQISVSSSLNGVGSGGKRVRLNTKETTETGGWLAEKRDKKQYVQIDFLHPVNLTGIITQGRNKHREWVETYTVTYSIDGSSWSNAYDENNEKVFKGNTDENTPVKNRFKNMITARFIRVNPDKYHNWISMRVEVTGCYEAPATTPVSLKTTTQFYPSVTTAPPRGTTPEIEDCIEYGPWLSLNTPSLSTDGDSERVGDLITASNLCQNPIDIECRDYLTHLDFRNSGQKMICDLTHGLQCNDREQKGSRCHNYEARIVCYTCPVVQTTTPLPPIMRVALCPEVPQRLRKNCPHTCPSGHVCDGHKCVLPFDCACYIGGKKYHPGDKVDDDDCRECTCQLQGHSNCAPKVCSGCTTGLKGWMNSNCECICEACPTGDVLCPTSGECISHEKWCDGVVDCTDDEKNCATTPRPTPTLPCPDRATPTCFPGTTLVRLNPDERCPEYKCQPQPTTPPPTVVVIRPPADCDVTGNYFKTFDGTEFPFDICNHVLVVDKIEKNFNITIHKDCSNVASQCSKFLVINHDSHRIRLGSDLTVKFNSQYYTAKQVVKLGQKFNDFTIYVVGNSVIFTSLKYGFEVSWDINTHVRITVKKTLVYGITGLCGFYSNDPNDDMQKRTGESALSVEDFGHSWSTEETDHCVHQICPVDIMTKALEACTELRRLPFNKCNSAVPPDYYIQTCLASICECMMNTDSSSHECACHAYLPYVEACQKHSPPIEFEEWRFKHGCVPKCPPGLEWHDCGPSCERTCDNLQEDLEQCDKHSCVSGCFCPPGLVKKDKKCIEKEKCQDCVCKGYGDPHYFTFDGLYYPFQGNCTYILARDRSLTEKHKFEVYATNEDCHEEPDTTCAVQIFVLYNDHVVHFKVNDSITFDGILLLNDDFPFEDFDMNITITGSPGRSVTFRIDPVHLEVRYFELNYGFEIRIPSEIYYNKTEGLCGNCNYNKSDDMEHKDGFLTEDVEEFALSWLAPVPKGMRVLNNVCTAKPDVPCKDAQQKEKCRKFLDRDFEMCHVLLDPEPYFKACEFDTCHSVNPEASLCRSLTEYARECAQMGICVQNWRSENLCPAPCPVGMHFDQCGPGCMHTCKNKDQYRRVAEECDLEPVEGCFCTGNRILKDGNCVDKSMCEICDLEGHTVGDTWQPNPCTSCSCNTEVKVQCTESVCPSRLSCLSGQFLKVIPADNNTCCDTQLCVSKPPPDCPQAQIPTCPPGEIADTQPDEHNCPHYVCVCDTTKCPPVQEPMELEIGEEVVLNQTGCCPVKKVVCRPQTCPPPLQCPPPTALNRLDTHQCCPEYECKSPPDMCEYEHYFVVDDNGKQTVNIESVKKLYKPGESWTDGYCLNCKCQGSGIGHYKVQCTGLSCLHDPDLNEKYVVEFIDVPYECCNKVKRLMCKDGDQKYTIGKRWHPDDANLCLYMQCSVTEDGQAERLEMQVSCNVKCKPEEKYMEPSASECCGHCERVACLDFDHNVKQVGEKWTFDEGPSECWRVECVKDDKHRAIEKFSSYDCPDVTNCPEDKINRTGCCPVCTVPPTPQLCFPREVDMNTIRMFEVYHKGQLCTNKHHLDNLTECYGKCESHSIFSSSKHDFVPSCHCCLPLQTKTRKIQLECGDGSEIPFEYKQPTSCACSPCTGADTGDQQIRFPGQRER